MDKNYGVLINFLLENAIEFTVETFPSGAVMVDCDIHGMFTNIQYYGNEFGLSFDPTSSFSTVADEHFTSVEELLVVLEERLNHK